MSAKHADDWEFIWQNLSEGMARNPARDFRFNAIVKSLPRRVGLKVLDFGCGTGNLLSILENQLPRNLYFGADTSLEAIRATTELCPNVLTGLIELTNGSPKTPWPVGFFDVVICSEVLEHINDDMATIKVLNDLLSEGGC